MDIYSSVEQPNKAKLTRSQDEKQQLQGEIKEVREREKRTQEELERKLIEKQNEVEHVTVMKEKEMSKMKQNYEKKISTLENQLKDKDLKIESLTEERDQLNRFIEKIQKEAEIKQTEAVTEQLTVQQEETNKLLAEQKAKCEELEKVMAEKNTEMEKMKEVANEKIRKLEDKLKKAFKPIKLDHISSQDVNLLGIVDMTVMRETGLIVVSTGDGSLYQLSLQQGRLIEKEIKHPCKHGVPTVYLLCVQVAGREYLAMSCFQCKNIKLMVIPKRKEDILRQFGSSSGIQYEVITAFSGEYVSCMCRDEENRLFIQSSDKAVLELDTSTTPFKIARTINTGYSSYYIGLCYVPDPHRFLVVSVPGEVRAVSCDDNTVVWRVQKDDDLDPCRLLYIPSHNAILVADRYKDRVVVLNKGTGLQVQSIMLPHNVSKIRGICLFNDQIIVASEGDRGRISYCSLK